MPTNTAKDEAIAILECCLCLPNSSWTLTSSQLVQNDAATEDVDNIDSSSVVNVDGADCSG